MITKAKLIELICAINKSAKSEHLKKFSKQELSDYVDELVALELEQMD